MKYAKSFIIICQIARIHQILRNKYSTAILKIPYITTVSSSCTTYVAIQQISCIQICQLSTAEPESTFLQTITILTQFIILLYCLIAIRVYGWLQACISVLNTIINWRIHVKTFAVRRKIIKSIIWGTYTEPHLNVCKSWSIGNDTTTIILVTIIIILANRSTSTILSASINSFKLRRWIHF